MRDKSVDEIVEIRSRGGWRAWCEVARTHGIRTFDVVIDLQVATNFGGPSPVAAELVFATLNDGSYRKHFVEHAATLGVDLRVDDLPVHGNSAAIVRSIGLDEGLHPDFGSGKYQGARIGIPYVSVPRDQRKVRVRFGYAEGAVGTNGVGTVLEFGESVHIVGAEHFAVATPWDELADALLDQPPGLEHRLAVDVHAVCAGRPQHAGQGGRRSP